MACIACVVADPCTHDCLNSVPSPVQVAASRCGPSKQMFASVYACIRLSLYDGRVPDFFFIEEHMNRVSQSQLLSG